MPPKTVIKVKAEAFTPNTPRKGIASTNSATSNKSVTAKKSTRKKPTLLRSEPPLDNYVISASGKIAKELKSKAKALVRI